MASHCPQDEMKTQHFSKIHEIWLPLTLYSHLFLITLFTKLWISTLCTFQFLKKSRYSYVSVYNGPFSPIIGRLSCFHFPVILDIVAVNILIHYTSYLTSYLWRNTFTEDCKISIKLIPFHYVTDFPPHYENSHLINLFSSNLMSQRYICGEFS